MTWLLDGHEIAAAALNIEIRRCEKAARRKSHDLQGKSSYWTKVRWFPRAEDSNVIEPPPPSAEPLSGQNVSKLSTKEPSERPSMALAWLATPQAFGVSVMDAAIAITILIVIDTFRR